MELYRIEGPHGKILGEEHAFGCIVFEANGHKGLVGNIFNATHNLTLMVMIGNNS